MEIPIRLHKFLEIFWSYRIPHPQEIPANSFCVKSMDIFWNSTIINILNKENNITTASHTM